MSDLSKILHQAFPRPSALSALTRWLKTLAGRGAEGASSALSLAMLVFLVQEARANAPASVEGEASVAPEAAGLDTIAQLFDAQGRSAGAVAGVEYSDIALALAQIYAAYGAELAAVEGELAADAADASAMDLGAEMAVLDSHLQDAIQYAALGPEFDLSGGGSDMAAAPAEEESDDRGFLPFLFFGAGVALVAQQAAGAATPTLTPSPTQTYYTSSGYAADGYISGATIFQDLNGNGKWDQGEPKGTTDASGKFSLNLVQNSAATLIVTGGTDISTGLAFTGVLKAPPGSSVVTPLTTMVQALIESSDLTLAEAKAVVTKAYLLDASKDLLNFDPFSVENQGDAATLGFQKANIFIASVMTTGASLLSSAGDMGGEAAYLKMASAISSLLDGRFVPAVDGYGYGEYEDAASIKALLVLAAAGLTGDALAAFNAVTEDVSVAIANSTRDLASANDLNGLVAAQVAAQDTLVAAIQKAVDQGSTGDLTAVLQHPIELDGALAMIDGSTELNLLAGAKDPDASHVLGLTDVTYKVGSAAASSALPAGFTLSDAGVLTVDPTHAAYNFLGQGQTQTIVVSYTISDGDGSTVAQTATITVNGAAQTVEIKLASALDLYNAGTYYSEDDNVAVNVAGSAIASATGLRSLGLSDLGTLGADVIDIDGSAEDANLHMESADVQAMVGAGLRFATADTITLDVTTADLDAAGYDATGTGSYFAVSLNSAVSAMPHGLSLSGLGSLGVDVIDINGSLDNASLHMDSAGAQAISAAGLRFAADDTITLDITTDELGSADYNGTGSGSYLSGSLDSAVIGMQRGVSLSALGALGVDVIDIGGSTFNAALHIDSANAQQMGDAGLSFAAADTITLDATTDALGVAGYDGNGAGSYLSVSLSSAVNGSGLSLSALGALGVDVIDLNGSMNNAVLHIDSADVLAVGKAGLRFATNDAITLDLALESGAYDENGNGSHFASTLGAKDPIGGLILSDLVGLGVDVVDVVGKKGTPGDYTAHISVAEASIAFNAGLVFDSQDHIVLNVTSQDSLSGSTATVLAGVMNLNMQTGFGLDAVQFADGTAIALSGDQGLVNLLMGLTSSDTGDYSGTAGLEVKAAADFTVSDAMVKALLDAGIFTADAASTIKVDASADTDGHVATTLAQLAQIGADQVEVAGDAAYVDLGNVTNTDELTSLFESLNASEAYSLVTDADGNAVSTSLLLSSAQAEALAAFIESNTTELSNIGIDHVYAQVVGDAQSGDLLLGTDGHYREMQTAV